MHVLVTGGAGFIGSHTVDLLLREGAQVTVLDNLSTGNIKNLFPEWSNRVGLDLYHGDIRGYHDVAAAMKRATHVLHLAAQVSVSASIDDPVRSAEHNVTGFLNVLNAVKNRGLRLVYASSAAIYRSDDRQLDENAPADPISPYGLEKLINERYAHLFLKLYGINSLGLRYFNVYGPRQDPTSPYAGVISKFMSAARAGRAIDVHGDGSQSRDFVYVEDVARINLLALKNPHTGIRNVGTGLSTSILTLVRTIEDLVGLQLTVHHKPAVVGDIRHSISDVTALVASLGERPCTTLKNGLSQMID